MYYRISSLFQNSFYETLISSKEQIEIRGWVLNFRKQAENTFISIVDGSTSDPLQVITKTTEETSKYSAGSAVRIIGKLVVSPAKGQLFELLADNIILEGAVSSEYPISKTNLSLEYLRSLAHLRGRTRTFNSIFRIRHSMMMAIHKFFDSEGFLLLDPNIITTGECEGGAGVFQVTEKDISIPKNLPLIPFEKKYGIPSSFYEYSNMYDWSKDHFGKPVYLTVSSQLQLEALAMSMGKVYTMNKSFRSEHSTTHKHVSEFTHLEIEQCFSNLEDLMNVAERFVKYTMRYILENNRRELEILEGSAKYNEGIDKQIIKRYENIISKDFIRIRYSDAIELIRKEPRNLSKIPSYGEDMNSEHEKYLVDYFGVPVFLTHWPLEIKSFYMKQSEEGDGTCESFDLLMPYVGELIGASQRETNYDKLLEVMNKKGIKREPLEFYLDLRKYGSCEHGGFGLGCDRLLMFLTGVHNIKDVIPFPVSYTNCLY